MQDRFASRCALAGDPLLSVATKVGKSAFYRRQLFEVLVGEVGWLGVRHRASIADLSVRAACLSSAYRRRVNSGFDDYRSGVVSIQFCLTFPRCWRRFPIGGWASPVTFPTSLLLPHCPAWLSLHIFVGGGSRRRLVYTARGQDTAPAIYFRQLGDARPNEQW